MVKTQLETQKYDFEKDLVDHKERARKELSDMMIENQALQTKADDRRDRELIRQLRRDLDENKRRAAELISENTDLRRERDMFKMEKSEMFV